jgi:hypothetical protein
MPEPGAPPADEEVLLELDDELVGSAAFRRL